MPGSIKLPSITAAVLVGSLWMPIFLWSASYLSRNAENDLLQIGWFFIGFVLPALAATADLSYLGENLFKVRASRTDFESFYIPAWKRAGALFLSTVISVLILTILGFNFG